VVLLVRGGDLCAHVLGRDLGLVGGGRVRQVVVAGIAAGEREPAGGGRAGAHALASEDGRVDTVAGDRVTGDLAHDVAGVGGVRVAVVLLVRGGDLCAHVLGRDLGLVGGGRVRQVVVAGSAAGEREPAGGGRAGAHALASKDGRVDTVAGDRVTGDLAHDVAGVGGVRVAVVLLVR